MSDLTSKERRILEEAFGMPSGYVLGFSDRTFGEFFDEHVGVNIDEDRFREDGGSKARRMRCFWRKEPNYTVGRLLKAVLDECDPAWFTRPDLLPQCRAIVDRLLLNQPVADIDALKAPADDRDFDALSTAVRAAIENHRPQEGLDRLHTWMVKFVRGLCAAHGLSPDKSVPLNGLFGSYVKQLREEGHVMSDMAERILKSNISILDAYNHVRNNHSMAHANDAILGYDEALLITNHVASLVRYLTAIEERAGKRPALEVAGTSIPF